MGRPQKKGLDYFPLDVDLFSDLKIRKLLHNKGTDGLAVYCSALCMIYREGYHLKGDQELAFIIADTVRLKETRVQDIIEYCLSVGLFDRATYREHGVLTSKAIQARYAEICKQMKRTACILEYNLMGSQEVVSTEENIVSSEETQVNSAKSAQRKEKENKINISSPLPSPLSREVEDEEEEDFLIYKDFFSRYNEAVKSIGILNGRSDSEKDSMPIMRFLTDKEHAQSCIAYIANWPKSSPLYELRQSLEAMERRGQIKPIPYADWVTVVWIKANMTIKGQQRVVDYASKGGASAWETVVSLVGSCKGNQKIEKPENYILKCLANQ